MKTAASLLFVSATFALASCAGDAGTGPSPDDNNPGMPTSMVISPPIATLNSIGTTAPLAVELRDADGQVVQASVTWSTTNASVATVSGQGMVTGVASGTVDITATYASLSATSHITVAPAPSAIVITPGTVALTLGGGSQQLLATVNDSAGRPIANVDVQWSSSDATIATVSTSGVVAAVKAGSTRINAAASGLTSSANVTVSGGGGPSGPSCTTQPAFTEDLIDPASLKVITQIGVIGGANTSIVGRSYLMAVDGDGVRLPLKAPGALKVTGAKHYIPQGAPEGYPPDWSLLLDAGCGITIELYHVKDVAPSIKAVADTTIYPSSAWAQLPTPVSFAAGETFGWYMRGLNSVAFDLIAHDQNVVNKFANQAPYEGGRSNLLDIVCPWSLFAPAKRAQYLALIGAPTGQRVPGAGCGTVERDVAGTPAGQWFLSQAISSTFPFSKTGNYGDPLPIILGIDNVVYVGHIGPSDDIRIWPDNPTWKDPAAITTAWCYQTAQGASTPGWLFLRMNSATQMDVAYGSSGSCPATFPTSNFVSYYR